MSRFLIIPSKESDKLGVIGKDYSQLADVGRTKENIIIDHELKTYWYSSSSALAITVSTIQIKYNQTPEGAILTEK